jgi:Copper transport outer membrane protein, MctB
MFDLRYHVASLAAVFLALIIGILVGVGLSDRGFLGKAERDLLEHRIARLEGRLHQVSQQAARQAREQDAARTYIARSYPRVMRNRLRGMRIAVVFIGSVDRKIRSRTSATSN